MRISPDLSDLLFRALFCLIFIGLGGEHIVADELIQQLMPDWVPYKRLASIASGLWLVGWGGMILHGWNLRWPAAALGVFLVVVTLVVHVPGLLKYPDSLTRDCRWMWDIFQRSNLAKNLCLLGVCFHLLHHRLGKYSLQSLISSRR